MIDDAPFLLTSFEHGGRRYHVAAAFGEPDALEGTAARAQRLCAFGAPRRGAARRPVRLASRRAPGPGRAVPTLADAADAGPAAGGVDAGGVRRRRPRGDEATATPTRPYAAGAPVEHNTVDTITFRRAADGVMAEDRGLRGLHPMIAERMDLWRLSNFTLERLPSDHDVHLFRAVARENERDERLVAVGEVRDLTAVRDEHGRIAALPELERVARHAFEAMRTFQSRRRSRERLHWNRVMLYAWPVMEFEPDEARPVITRLGRMTAGLGLEMVLLRVRLAARRRRSRARGGAALLQPGRSRAWSPRSTRCRPSRCSRWTRAPTGSCRHGGGGWCTRRRSSRCSRPARRTPGSAIPPGEFVELDLDADGRAGGGRPAAGDQQRAAWSSGSCATGPSATRRGCCA